LGCNKIVNAINLNGTIYLFTEGGQTAGNLEILTELGSERVAQLRHDLAGTLTDFTCPQKLGGVDVWNNRLLFGLGNYTFIMSYGRDNTGYPLALTMPWALTGAAGEVGCVKNVANDKFYVASKVNTTYYLRKFSSGNSATAVYKGLYRDMGQKIRINYIKFYFKPLVSGDTATVSMDIDYGTSISPKSRAGSSTISYNEDGAITSKRFEVQMKCHSFRPVLTNTTISLSKIIIDYDYLPDDI